MKTVSIIIPAKNEEKYIPLCLDSIQKLDYPKEALEVIIVDNGSTDQTREIAQTFGAKVLRDDTIHVSGLRNLGANEARGEILAFVDADCTVAPDWLNAASLYFENDSVVAWGGPPVPPDEASWVQKTWFIMLAHKEETQPVDWLGTIDLFVRRGQFIEVGQFDEALATCEDVDFCYRISAKGRIISDARIKVVHLREADTLSAFFQKELWRGKSNFEGVWHHGLKWKELPSLGIPIYFLSMFILITVCGIYSPKNLLIVNLLFFLPGFLVTIKKSCLTCSFDFIKLLVLINIYFMARTIAVFKK